MKKQCKFKNIVKDLEEVSKICNTGTVCKSKLLPNKEFEVIVFGTCAKKNDPRRIFVQKATQQNKIQALNKLLRKAHFIDHVKELCKDRGKKRPSTCNISIKVNIAPASQKPYHYYTDPIIADLVVDKLKENGFSNVKLVESQTNAILANPEINPPNIGKSLGYRHPIHDLSAEPKSSRVKVSFKEGAIEVARSMVESDVIINIPKPKNHDLMKFTASLKNMYGSIPDLNKYMLFHHKKSGLNVEEATVAVNHTTPVDLIIADWVDSVDGNEVSYFDKDVKRFDHFNSHRLIFGFDSLTVDKYIAQKMGYQPEDSPILKEEEKFVGKKEFKSKLIKGDTVSNLTKWRKIGFFLNLKAKFQDYIPVNNKMVAWGIRNYRFPIVEKEED